MHLSGCASKQAPHPRQANDPALERVAWLEGTWTSDDGKTTSEECWTRPLGGTMFGTNRLVHDGETLFYEYLCIQNTPDGIFYLASPKGRQPPTPFKLIESDLGASHRQWRLVFENEEHDFPTRIIYWLEGDRLIARVEGTQDGKPVSEEWNWRRAKR